MRRCRVSVALVYITLSLSYGSNALGQTFTSTNISVNNSPGSLIEDHSVVNISSSSLPLSVIDLGLPSDVNISSLHFIDANTLLFTLKTAAILDSVTASAGDILQWDDGDVSLLVSRSSLGLSPATKIDALAMSGDAMVFSTSISDVINGIAVSDSDLLSWTSGGGSQLLHVQSVCGIPSDTNLTGVHLMDTGEFLMVFSNAFTVAELTLRKGDVARCNPSTGVVVLHTRLSDLGANWAAVGLDAITGLGGELIFVDGFENSNL